MADRVLWQTDDDLSQSNLENATHRQNAVDYVERGLSLTGYDSATPAVDVTSGHCVISDGSGSAWDVFPDARSGVSLSDGAVNDVYVSVDPNAQDDITVEAFTSGVPSVPYVKVGEVDTSADSVSEVSRNPSAEYDTVESQSIHTEEINTVKWVDPSEGTQAINDAIGEGVKIRLKSGVYTGPEIFIDETPLIIEGAGWQSGNGNGGTVIRPSDTAAIRTDGAASSWVSPGAKAGVLRNFEIDGSNLDAGAHSLDLEKDTAHWEHDFLHIHDSPQDGVHGVRIYHNEFHNCFIRQNGRHGVFLDRDAGDIASAVSFRECYISYNQDGVHAPYCGNLTIDSTSLNDNTGRGLFFEKGNAPGFYDIDLERNDTAAVIGSGAAFNPKPVSIFGGTLFDNDTGIVVNGGTKLNILGVRAEETTNLDLDLSGMAAGAEVYEAFNHFDSGVDRSTPTVYSIVGTGSAALAANGSLRARQSDGTEKDVLSFPTTKTTVLNTPENGSAVRCDNATVADDSVVSFDASLKTLAHVTDGASNMALYLMTYDGLTTVQGDGSIINEGGTTLNGTTGTDGNINVARDDNTLLVENRLGSSVDISVQQFGA